MSRRNQWGQCVCSQCHHINFVPPHDIDFMTIPCAHCGNVALVSPDVSALVVMPKFLAKPA